MDASEASGCSCTFRCSGFKSFSRPFALLCALALLGFPLLFVLVNYMRPSHSESKGQLLITALALSLRHETKGHNDWWEVAPPSIATLVRVASAVPRRTCGERVRGAENCCPTHRFVCGCDPLEPRYIVFRCKGKNFNGTL